MQTLPFHPNSKTHDHETRIKHNIHNPSKKLRFDRPRIINNCPNSILDKINIHSIQGYSGYKTHFLQTYKENCTIVDCYVCNKYI